MTYNDDVMIDLETMSLQSNAAILSIGAVRFCRFSGVIHDEYYSRINIIQAENRHIDPSTIRWWMLQSEEARSEAFNGGDDIEESLDKLSVFVNKQENTKVWSNGSCFDIMVLEDYYRQLSMDIPWEFYNIRDCRTIEDVGVISRKEFEREGTHHNALDDAKHQVRYISANIRSMMTRELP